MSVSSEHILGRDTGYYPVSPAKFTALSIVTFGIYQLFWFFKNWEYVRDRDHSNISPLWRAVFSVVWCYPLIEAVRDYGDDESRRTLGHGGLIAIAYLLLASAAYSRCRA